MRHTETHFVLQLPDGRWLTIEQDYTDGESEGIIVCLAKGEVGSDVFGDTISREPVWEPEPEENEESGCGEYDNPQL